MFFKNVQLYRLPNGFPLAAEALEEALSKHAISPASSNELLRQGWQNVRPNGGLVHVVNKQFLIRLGSEKKLLPNTVVNQITKARAAEIEETQGYAMGKRGLKELKERVFDELLPRAFPIHATTDVWIDTVNGWLVVNSPTPAKADDVIKHLLKAVDGLDVQSLRVQRSPVATMTEWLQEDTAPAGFTVDMDTELRATGESKAAVKYVRHSLEPDEIRKHIKAGKQCARLALTWDSKISFVLTNALAIKSIKALDVLSEKDGTTKNDEERFDGEFMLMSGELSKMFADVVDAMGGYAKV